MTTISVLAQFMLVIILASVVIYLMTLAANSRTERRWSLGIAILIASYACMICAFHSLAYFADVIRQ